VRARAALVRAVVVNQSLLLFCNPFSLFAAILHEEHSMSDRSSSPAASEPVEEVRALKRRRVEFEDAQTQRGDQAERSR